MRTLQVDDEALGDKPDLAAPADQPSHVRIASWLLSQIGARKVRPDDKLPPEEELAAALGVSRMTLRQALGSLEARGYIGLMRQHYGLVPHHAKEWLEPEICSAEHAQLLGIEPGSALMLVTRKASTATGVAVEYAHDRYRSDRTRISLHTGIEPHAETELIVEPV